MSDRRIQRRLSVELRKSPCKTVSFHQRLLMVCAQFVHFQSSNISCPLEKGIRLPFSHFGHGGKKSSAIFSASKSFIEFVYLIFSSLVLDIENYRRNTIIKKTVESGPAQSRNDVMSMMAMETTKNVIRRYVRWTCGPISSSSIALRNPFLPIAFLILPMEYEGGVLEICLSSDDLLIDIQKDRGILNHFPRLSISTDQRGINWCNPGFLEEYIGYQCPLFVTNQYI